MRLNTETLKHRLNNGHKLIGPILLLPSADVAEIVGLAGVQIVMIDQEHGTGGLQDYIAQARAMEGTGTHALVRIPASDYACARRLLDAGCRAIVCPGVETEEHAKEFVAACFYPLRGGRGAGGGIRAAAYGLDATYYETKSESDLLVTVQIESLRAVENIDRICRVEGIDMLLIGPRDLAASMGLLDRMEDPELWRVVEHAEQRILASGKLLASTLHPGKTPQDMFGVGYNLILSGKDVDFLLAGAKAVSASV
jgi:4-hydroxy-2-oxoheptanedioate aldolase